MQTPTYHIKLEQFEGPFDLLLFFIERDELDIHDVPIAKLADEFLDYLHLLERLNIDLASEFMLVAATLMQIKARLLLPRKELNEAGEEIDPRMELVQRLLEYKQYKEVSAELEVLEEARAMRFERGNLEEENDYIAQKFSTENEIESISLYKLLQVFTHVMDKLENRNKKVKFSVVKHPYTIGQQKEYCRMLMLGKSQASFEDVFSDCENRIAAIFRFLALLELIQERWLQIQLGLDVNVFWISRNEEENNDTLSNQDDSAEAAIAWCVWGISPMGKFNRSPIHFYR